jgi:hypothetical protein
VASALQERLFVGPVVKKEFHLNQKPGNQSLSANFRGVCEWDVANFKVWMILHALQRLRRSAREVDSLLKRAS